jgi:hypothetical protein
MTTPPTRRPLLPLPVALAGFAFGACLLASATVSAQTAPWAKPPPTPTVAGAGFGLRLDHLVFPNAGVEQTRGYVGVVLRPIEHLAFDVGIGFGGGRWRRPWAVDSFATFDATLDARLYLNPRSPLQLFALGGVGLGFASASTSLTPSVTPGDCPGDAMMFYDLSGGVGAELRLGRHGSLLVTARLVRRSRFAGELTFATESVNPPLVARDEALGASFGIALVGYFSR